MSKPGNFDVPDPALSHGLARKPYYSDPLANCGWRAYLVEADSRAAAKWFHGVLLDAGFVFAGCEDRIQHCDFRYIGVQDGVGVLMVLRHAPARGRPKWEMAVYGRNGYGQPLRELFRTVATRVGGSEWNVQLAAAHQKFGRDHVVQRPTLD